MQHVNPSFNIQAQKIDFERAQLFIECGTSGISIAVLDGNSCFKAVVVYSFSGGLPETEIVENLDGIFRTENLLQRHYHKTNIFWSFPESILVPVELMNAERNINMINLVFGDAQRGIIRSDFLYKHNLHHVYRTPQTIIDIFSSHLPVATQTHLFSTIVNRDIPEGNHVVSIFYSNSITIMLSKEAKLQVIQNFVYLDADDCVFHLLNVCKGFEVPPESVHLHVSGMIDEKSGLYAAVHKYFLHIEFEKLPDGYKYYETITNHPSHFFRHLFALASCV